MYWLLFGVGAFIFMLGFAPVVYAYKRQDYYWNGWSIVTMIAAFVVVFVVMLTFGIRMLDLHYGRAGCNSIGKQYQLHTKFVQLPGGSTECLVRVKSGKWIPVDQIGNYNQ